MTEWRWLRSDSAEAIHQEQLAEHGGPAGVRDAGALLSALARPANLAAYGDPDAAALAAAYAFGVARNHPFVDGNKRTAWVLARLFLEKNGLALHFEPAEAVVTMLSLAADDLAEDELAAWFRERISGV
ncbi:type II toxin-antitoxin system death-on-curing family toxin [Sphingomonas sp.]|uniref:type II toxin-antitoxin system death-on-curing family toxin n=1 Tax=Sphingomonas sp. TaxID=28214 RepID=UPI00286E1BBA|nr:type II toxin-antitoxin system death-on-curing family toxin [Sphingomonas sp.]